MQKKFFKDTFKNIPPEKQKKIINAALDEFYEKGLADAKIQDVATRAGVSYGSIYSYFPTKDDLIHTIIQEGIALQEEIFGSQELAGLNVFDRLREVLLMVFSLSKDEARYIPIWIAMSLSHNRRFSDHTLEIEKEGVDFWKEFIRLGKEAGDIDSEIPDSSAAYIVDSVVAGLLKVHISDHEAARFGYYFSGFPENIQDIVESLVKVLKRMLSPVK